MENVFSTSISTNRNNLYKFAIESLNKNQNRTVIHVQIIIEISIIISTQRFFLTPYKFFNTNVDDFKSLYQFSIPTSPMVYQPNRFNTDGLIDGMAVNTFQYRRSSARKALLETLGYAPDLE